MQVNAFNSLLTFCLMFLQLPEGRRTGALAMKVGMISVYDKWGICHPTTVLQLDSCRVLQVKTEETDGYTALQLGIGEAKKHKVKEPLRSHIKKWSGDANPPRQIQEFRVTKDCLLEPGTLVQAMHFVPGQVSLFNLWVLFACFTFIYLFFPLLCY